MPPHLPCESVVVTSVTVLEFHPLPPMLGFKSHAHTQMERDRTADAITHEHAHLSGFTHMYIRCFVGACQPVLCEDWVRVELMTQEILAAQVL